MKAFINWFLNFFRSNLVIMQIAIQEMALAIFKSRPGLKVPVSTAIAKIQAIISGNPDMSLVNVPGLIKSKILESLPPEQQVIFGSVIDQMVIDISAKVNAYILKQNITAPYEQLKVVSQVLSWVDQMAKL